ncbi:YbaB/EbfC family nucleoid-associated protein [Nocardia wallacei]|uniref:YbaB/EbfC family nucleoid-associated protein n=1 Tax=Nocardia wallacei TaxID=480035 RepID=UPI002454DF23|nr:YbaB/EbfC family nucleoid-associated protein [Nocardia wallacei]
MTEHSDLDASIEEMRAKASRVQTELKKIRGTGTAANGTITATVDSAGHLRDLKLPANPGRLGPRLASLILQATRAAETDAAQQAARAMRPLTSDDRVQAGLKVIQETLDERRQAAQRARPMTEAEVLAADDAYFERMNRLGWKR